MVKILLSHPEIDVNWGRVELDVYFRPMPYGALDVASQLGLQEVVRLLVNHPKIVIETTGPGNFSALHFASKGGSVEVVKILLTKIDVNTADIKGQTALHIASLQGHSDIVELLLGQPEIDVNRKTNDTVIGGKTFELGYTALYMASQQGHAEIVDLLLQHPGLDAGQEASNYGWQS